MTGQQPAREDYWLRNDADGDYDYDYDTYADGIDDYLTDGGAGGWQLQSRHMS